VKKVNESKIILGANAVYHVYESKAEDGNVVALRGLHLEVREGEAVAVVGPSGSGKSTLMKCLGGLMKPSAGNVSLDGRNMTRLTGQELVELRQETISFIFQEGNLLPHMNALDNVAQPLRHQGVPPRVAKARALELMGELGIAHRAKGLPSMLSGGEQQRVAIARALITNPRLILADEPTGALDPITSREVLALFKELHEEKGVAFLIVTHSAEVSAFCDRSLELRDGRFVAQHGADVEVEDLSESRELIVDDLGTVAFPPDVLLAMGGAGRYTVERAGDGSITLRTNEGGQSLLQSLGTLAPQCPACNHAYTDEAQECPSCGSSRPYL